MAGLFLVFSGIHQGFGSSVLDVRLPLVGKNYINWFVGLSDTDTRTCSTTNQVMVDKGEEDNDGLQIT